MAVERLGSEKCVLKGRYSITTPTGKTIEGPPAGSYWRVSKEKFEELDADNRIWWEESGSNRPGIKRFLSEVQQGVVPQTIWHWKDVGSTRHAKQELSQALDLGPGEDAFVTPKPSRLIRRILQVATDPDSIVLDSFAGSGTTAHAVLAENREDAGNRRFILVEFEDYADSSPLSG
ncbi:MAG: site-specific DNA-methyltransferase [bacterium]|nr:site-specific DNA-methyltransferase [bacterium]MCY3889611.1 site-specific DNA-methyltransferase [bacterium]